MFLKKKITAHL